MGVDDPQNSAPLYCCMKKICLLAPNLQVNLVEVVADFEVAMHSSIRALIITAIQIIGCCFHFCQVPFSNNILQWKLAIVVNIHVLF